ncbi:MAG: alpha/beta hydrolase, partial [Alphaproteobacteria bacterium]
MKISVNGHDCVHDLSGQGANLALLHSVGLSSRDGWRHQVGELAQHHRVLSYDIRGLGCSERGGAPLGIATFADDLAALLAALDIGRTVIMGVSLGGFIAQAFTLAHPEIVTALVLVSTTCHIPGANAARRENRNQAIHARGMEAAVDGQIASHFSPDYIAANPETVAWYRAHYLATDPESYIEIMNDLGEFDRCGEIGAITCPTLIVAGADDTSSVSGKDLASAHQLTEEIPGAELVVIPGALHYPH